MTRHVASIDRTYFDNLYASDADPWRFATSDYERDKYAATLAALPDRRFGSALEVGCSIGILTRQLASRCDSLLAIDVADAALARARENCPDANIAFANRQVPREWPGGQYDLIVFSEVLYYLDLADLGEVAKLARDDLTEDGVILLVHFTEETNYPLTGDRAAEDFIAAAGLPVTRHSRAPRYRLDVLDAAGPKRN
jgi:predicted TPR repeat methyltransferase